MTEIKTFVIILGGGIGSRMEYHIPKQFIPLKGKPVIMHTIHNFHHFDPKMEIIVVLPEAHIALWKDLCNEFKFDIEHQIVRGGSERFYSVKNALDRIPEGQLVLIHDGVRPLVTHETIDRVRQTAIEKGNAIPYIDHNESLRQIVGETSKAVKREKYKIIQTPQAFNSTLIKNAYQLKYRKSFTDDASVLEASGTNIEMVLGNLKNIKITRSIDLSIAESLMAD
jgi:2-C-methyl-D-erythritol 4-phosphate cytidylyltransferase